MPNKSKVYSYVRFSTGQQAVGDSERRQVEAAKAWASAHGMELDSTINDLGRSAFAAEHVAKDGALGGFMALAEAGKVAHGSVVLVESIDRLSRQRFENALSTITRILKCGIDIITLEDNVKYTHENYDQIQLIIPLVVKITAAHEYSKRLSARIGPAKDQLVKEARATGKPITRMLPGWLRKNADGSGFDVIPERVAIIKNIFQWTIDGEGCVNVANRLNKMGLPTFTKQEQGLNQSLKNAAKQWSGNLVADILRNRSVIGEYQPHKQNVATAGKRVKDGDPLVNYYPIVIDIDTWTEAHKQRQKRKHGGGHKEGRVNNLFAGLIYCRHCQGRMFLMARVHNKKSHEAFYCASALRNGGCKAKGNIKNHLIENATLDTLRAVNGFGLFDVSDQTSDLDAIRENITRLSQSIAAGEARLADWLASDPSPRVIKLLATEEAKIDALAADLALERQRLADATETSQSQNANLLDRLRGDVQIRDYDARLKARTVIKSLITKIDCDPLNGTASIWIMRKGFVFLMHKDGTVDVEHPGLMTILAPDQAGIKMDAPIIDDQSYAVSA